MSENSKAYESLQTAFPAIFKGRAEAPWLQVLRRSAADHFTKIGFPTTADEEWVNTSVQPMTKESFVPATASRLTYGTDRMPFVAQSGAVQLAFVNGLFYAPLSNHVALPPGVEIAPLSSVLQKTPNRVEPFLGKHARLNRDAFTALNTALFLDGAWIYVPRGVVIDQPIHLLFLSSPNGALQVASPRNLIVAEDGSEVAVIETYFGPSPAKYWTNSVTEIVSGPNATVRHYKLQEEAPASFHVGTVTCQQERSSRFISNAVQIGGGWVRNNIDTRLDAEGAECTLNGLFVTSGTQHVDNHTTIDHLKPHSTSREMYKGILAHKSRGVFDGKIIVHPNAQKTDARQTSRNLLLSEDALIDTTPRLEIYADDVKCAHGATIGSLDEEAIFYFRSRGIDKKEARQILTHAFANEIVDGIAYEPLKKQLSCALLIYLSGVAA